MIENRIFDKLFAKEDLSTPPLSGSHIAADSPILGPTIGPEEAKGFGLLAGKCSLVLEGGAMRGVFTAGVLDCFMDAEIVFPYVVAVSAGACNALSYVSGQKRRNRAASVDMMAKYDYISLKNLPEQHSLIDLELMFDLMPRKILPFDFSAYVDSATNLEIVATDAVTGHATYFGKAADEDRLLAEVKASCSMPFACPLAMVGDREYADGGVADPIPVRHALSTFAGKSVVVCTHERGYREPLRDYMLPSLVYHDYPRLRVSIIRMDEVYNRQLDLVEKLEEAGEIVCIRPRKPVSFEHFEQDVDVLNALYEEGYNVTKELLLSYGG